MFLKFIHVSKFFIKKNEAKPTSGLALDNADDISLPFCINEPLLFFIGDILTEPGNWHVPMLGAKTPEKVLEKNQQPLMETFTTFLDIPGFSHPHSIIRAAERIRNWLKLNSLESLDGG